MLSFLYGWSGRNKDINLILEFFTLIYFPGSANKRSTLRGKMKTSLGLDIRRTPPTCTAPSLKPFWTTLLYTTVQSPWRHYTQSLIAILALKCHSLQWYNSALKKVVSSWRGHQGEDIRISWVCLQMVASWWAILVASPMGWMMPATPSTRKAPRRLLSGEGTRPILIHFMLVVFVGFLFWEIWVWNIYLNHLANFCGYKQMMWVKSNLSFRAGRTHLSGLSHWHTVIILVCGISWMTVYKLDTKQIFGDDEWGYQLRWWQTRGAVKRTLRDRSFSLALWVVEDFKKIVWLAQRFLHWKLKWWTIQSAKSLPALCSESSCSVFLFLTCWRKDPIRQMLERADILV